MSEHEPLTDEQVRAIQPHFIGDGDKISPERRAMAEFKADLLRERAEQADERRDELVRQMADLLETIFPDLVCARSKAERFVDLIRAISQERHS